MILLRLIKAIVLYIRYTSFEFYHDALCYYKWELKQRTDVPLKYRYTIYFSSRTRIGCIYQAIKRSVFVITDLFKYAT